MPFLPQQFTPKPWRNRREGGTPVSAAALIDSEARQGAHTAAELARLAEYADQEIAAAAASVALPAGGPGVLTRDVADGDAEWHPVQIIDVTSSEYGVTGDISQADAMTRINAAIEDAHGIGTDGRNTLAGGTIVQLPDGICIANEPMKYREGVWTRGLGPKATVILRKANTTTKMLEPASLAENTWAVSDMRFDGNRANQTVPEVAIALDRGDYPTYDVPGFLAGPAVTGFISPLFGGGDLVGLHNLIVSNILGKGVTTTGQCSQFHIRGLFVWYTSDHGIDAADVDNEWTRIQVGNCGRAALRAAGANNRYSHIKLYQSDTLGEGWGALELTGQKHNFNLLEVQEAGTQGIRATGSDNEVTGRVDGCRAVGLLVNGGSRSTYKLHVNSFPAYGPTYLAGFGQGVFGNHLDLIGRIWSKGALQGAVVGNEVRLNGSLI